MIGRHRIGLLGQALLMLGVVDLSPPPREPEIDMAAVEKAMQGLAAAGISAAAVLDAAGAPRRFVETAQKCLSMQAALAAQGQPSVDVVHLLARHDDLIRRPLPTRPTLHGFESNPREGMPAPRRPYPAPAAARCTCGGAGICSEYCAGELAAGRMAHPDGPCALGFEDRCKRCRRENRKHQRAQRGALRPQQAAARKTKAAKKARRGF